MVEFVVLVDAATFFDKLHVEPKGKAVEDGNWGVLAISAYAVDFGFEHVAHPAHAARRDVVDSLADVADSGGAEEANHAEFVDGFEGFD